MVAAALAYASLAGSSVVGCSAGKACSHILASRWAYIAGFIPVSLPGFLLYLCLLVGWIRRSNSRLIPVLEWTVLLAALWFMGLQAFVLRAFCPWCSGAHLCASLAVLLRWHRSPYPSDSFQFLRSCHVRHALPAAASVLGLAAVQYWGAAPPTSRVFSAAQVQTPGPASLTPAGLATQNGLLFPFDSPDLALDPRRLPVLDGPADWSVPPMQGVPLVLLQDWCCEHCRGLHAALSGREEALPILGPLQAAVHPPLVGGIHVGDGEAFPRLLVTTLPAWHDATSEQVHRLMLTAWLGARPVYTAAEHAIVSGQLIPTPQEVERFLAARNGASWPDLKHNLAAPVDDIMKLGRKVLAAADARLPQTTLPMLIAGHGTLVGQPAPLDLRDFLTHARQSPTTRSFLTATTDFRLAANAPTPVAPPAQVPPPPTNKSRIEFKQSRLSLPPVPQGESRDAEFHFTNTGTDPLQITGVQTSCGCTVVSDWQQTVPPGHQGSLRTTFHSAGKPPGPQLRTITLRSTAENQPVATLSLEIEVLPPANALAASPSQPAPSSPAQSLRAAAAAR